MSVQQKNVNHISACGFADTYRKGLVNIIVSKSDKIKEDASEYYMNITQEIGGVNRDLYFGIPDIKRRPLLTHVDQTTGTFSVIQDWATLPEETGTVHESDRDVVDLKKVLDILHAEVCKKEHLDPALYPLVVERIGDSKDEKPVYYSIPVNVKDVWSYDKWTRSPGVPTFKIKFVHVRHASRNGKGFRDNQIFIGFQIGKHKFDPNFKKQRPKTAGVKRSATEEPEGVRSKKTNRPLKDTPVEVTEGTDSAVSVQDMPELTTEDLKELDDEIPQLEL